MQDYPDVAALVGADGVHLTEPDFSIPHVRRMLGEDKLIGIDFTSVRNAVAAEESGVDYISMSVSKTANRAIIRLKNLKEIVTIPIIAISDAPLTYMRDLIHAGIDGIAIMSHMYQGNELHANIKRTVALLHAPQSL